MTVMTPRTQTADNETFAEPPPDRRCPKVLARCFSRKSDTLSHRRMGVKGQSRIWKRTSVNGGRILDARRFEIGFGSVLLAPNPIHLDSSVICALSPRPTSEQSAANALVWMLVAHFTNGPNNPLQIGPGSRATRKVGRHERTCKG
jgi:hypothetical protein